MEPESPDTPARVAILGLGLMGGSLGLALKRAWPASVITGYDIEPAVAERARARGAIDMLQAFVAEALTGATLVVIATPTLAARNALREIGACWERLAPHAVITDVCSVKGPLAVWAREELPQPARFVGGHPICGSERAGIEAASVDLYMGARWVISPTPESAPAATAQVDALARAAGAAPMRMDPETHDGAVAGISHAPLAVAAALAGALAAEPEWPVMAALAAGGYRDTTRVAAGDPIMGRDMLLANRERVLVQLDAVVAAVMRLRAALAKGDAKETERLLRAASEARRAWAANHANGAGDDGAASGVL
ncbi:MAG TPA: prephenate dehydrogenase/arogenate dehydrogenase family protein [Ktedonobacterales bacterium]